MQRFIILRSKLKAFERASITSMIHYHAKLSYNDSCLKYFGVCTRHMPLCVENIDCTKHDKSVSSIMSAWKLGYISSSPHLGCLLPYARFSCGNSASTQLLQFQKAFDNIWKWRTIIQHTDTRQLVVLLQILHVWKSKLLKQLAPSHAVTIDAELA